jgi:hypothetical protein
LITKTLLPQVVAKENHTIRHDFQVMVHITGVGWVTTGLLVMWHNHCCGVGEWPHILPENRKWSALYCTIKSTISREVENVVHIVSEVVNLAKGITYSLGGERWKISETDKHSIQQQ